MDRWGWMEILREHPDRASECPCWDDFTPMEWIMISEAIKICHYPVHIRSKSVKKTV